MNTEYRNIPGFFGYRVGTDGSVWTCRKRIKLRNNEGGGYRIVLGDAWREIRGQIVWSGYRRITLYRDKKRTRHYIHRLVLEAFVGPCPSGMEACHDPDHDRSNCRLDNLRWDTRVNNHADAIRDGRTLVGERNPSARLNSGNVLRIRELAAEGQTHRSLAEKYGVDRSTISLIVRREKWKHL